MIWILAYVVYAFIQGAVFVRCFEKRTFTPFAWSRTINDIVWASAFAPAVTALAIVTSCEWVWGKVTK